MRIGIEITPLSGALTGVGYYVRHLLAELLRQPDAPDYRGFASGVNNPQLSGLPLPYRRIPVPTRLLYKCWDIAQRPHVDALLGGVDVFHAVNYVLPPVRSARRVLSIHDLCFLRHPEWASPKIVKPFQRNIKRHANQADKIIACSEATRQNIVSLLEVPPDRVQVIYDAADIIFHPIKRELAQEHVFEALGIDAPYLLFVGTCEPRKNIEGLLTAFAQADLPHRLVIAGGSGWNTHSLAERAVSLNVADRVLFTGYLHERSLFPALYNAADAFVFPSWHEGFGMPVLEAMACGCPVIASDATSLPEVGGTAAHYVAPDDAEALTQAMQEVTSNPELQKDMREQGLQQAKRFSWSKCAEETLACYRSLV